MNWNDTLPDVIEALERALTLPCVDVGKIEDMLSTARFELELRELSVVSWIE